MTKVFISYSSKDINFIEKEILPLLRKHPLSIWYSEKSIKATKDWERTILENLQTSDWIIVVLSPNAVASDWVRSEVHWALEKKPERVIPIIYKDCDPSYMHLKMPRIQFIDYRKDIEAARSKLLDLWGFNPNYRDSHPSPPHSTQRLESADRFLRRHIWLILSAIYVLAFIISFLNGLYISTVLILSCALICTGLMLRKRSQILPKWMILFQIVVFLMANIGEAGYISYKQHNKSTLMQAFVNLSFEGGYSVSQKDLLYISKVYHSTLEQAFSGLGFIRIMPELFDDNAFKTFSPRHSYARVIQELNQFKYMPDLIIRNHVEFIGKEPDSTNVILLSSFCKLGNSQLLDLRNEPIRNIGTKADIQYLALKAAFELVLRLREIPGLELSKDHECQVKRNILESYRRFLFIHKERFDHALFSRIKETLMADNIEDQEIYRFMDAYAEKALEENSDIASIRKSNLIKTRMSW